ncbi:MAG: YbaB/EbfC family nucleoid-associated protein [Pseudomonadota bacterium]
MFKGLGGLGDMAKLMSQAGELQQKLADAQARVAEIEVEGSAGGGMVRARATGKGVVTGLEVDQSLIDGTEEKAVLEDLVTAAVNDALSKAREAGAAEMAKATEGLPLPPGMAPPLGG